ncbi:MAG TPA: glycoside hydrolase family 36 protein, partial [Candidatus Binataceae bacterium]|nr:glycoside hydrolase family 36 protein [Candidatus Binataceae bacterium]
SARVNAPYQRGWCSWYQYFSSITEDALRSNLRRLKDLRREFPINLVQLDDGYQAALGDWEYTNDKFPGGLKIIADEIRSAGFRAGLWTAPFLATRDSHLMRAHPGWFMRNQNGEPLAIIQNPSWTLDEDKSAYALDPTHPEFEQYLERLFDRLVHEFGFTYLKLDFLFAAAAHGRRHQPDITRAQTLRLGLETIRCGADEQSFLLGCGCPLGPAVGVVDGMRIGPDVAPYWGGNVEPGTRLAIEAIIARSFMHRRLWLNDPDCLMLRSRETRLSREERFALAAAIAVSGGMMIISDNMDLLDSECNKLFQRMGEIGMEADTASHAEPPVAVSLMDDTAVHLLVTRKHDGVYGLFLNTADSPRSVSVSAIASIGQPARLLGPDGESAAPEQIELPAHSARIISC